MAESPAFLVIGPRWVGDMVMAQCLLLALKQLYPDVPIDVVAPAWAAPLLARMPQVRKRLDATTQPSQLGLLTRWRFGRSLRGSYDTAYILPGSWKSALVPFFAGIRKRVGHLRELRYGLLNDIVPLPQDLKRRTAHNYFSLARGGTFHFPKLSVDAANQSALLHRYGLREMSYIVLAPGAEFGAAKRWPAGHYAEFARTMTNRGLGVILLGSKNDAPVTAEIAALAPGSIDLAGQTRLEDAIDLLAGAGLAVANDSGLMHVAAAVGTRIIGVYGPTSPVQTPPLSHTSELVWLGLSCAPCHQRVCPLGHGDCMNTLSVALVVAAAERLLDKQPV